MMFTDISTGQYLLNSVLWFFAGVGLGYVGRDLIQHVRSNTS